MNAKHKKLLLYVLWVVAAACPIALMAWAGGSGFPVDEAVEIRVKLVFVVLSVALISIRLLAPGGLKAKQAGNWLSLAAFLAVLAYFNFGAFHGRVYVHYWEQFHYSIGAKYFPELGHDGLYAASIEAQIETYPQEAQNRGFQPHIRDLRDNKVKLTTSPAIAAHRLEVRARFSDERWQQFIDDHRHLLDANSRSYLYRIRMDHGFNPPPSWTFVARLFASWPSFDATSLTWLANLDVLLLLYMFVVAVRTWGGKVGALAMVLFGLNYAGRFYWVGGAFLREDWLAAVVIGICMLKQERFRIAGALFGYATMVRIFPVLFLFGPGIVALRTLLRREKARWLIDLGIGFAAAALLLLGAGTLAGRGPQAWTDFASAISLHKDTWLTNNVGLDNVLLYSVGTMKREMVDFSQPEPWIRWQPYMDQLKHDRRVLLWLAKGVMLLLLAGAAWRAGPAGAAAMSVAAVFAMVATTCYYWQMLLVLPFLNNTRLLYGALALNLGMMILHFQTGSFEARYGLFSWGLMLLFVGYLAPQAWATVKELRSAQTAEP